MNSIIKNGSKMNMNICMINVPNYYHLYSNQNNTRTSLSSYKKSRKLIELGTKKNFFHLFIKEIVTVCYPFASDDKGCPEKVNINYFNKT